MKITLDLDYDEATEWLAKLRRPSACIESIRGELCAAIENAIQDESERRYEQQQESLIESGGVDDSREREQLRDAGRGHLIR